MDGVWEKVETKIGEVDLGEEMRKKELYIKEYGGLHNFYNSYYACPICKKMLFKTVFPVGREYAIEVENESNRTVKLKRAFLCKFCQAFFAAAKVKLADGVIYQYLADNIYEYNWLLNDMDARGTTKGRRD